MISCTHQLLDYSKFRPYSDTFIETGSCYGEGIQRALDAGFLHVSSIEADPRFFQITQERFFTSPNVDHRVHLYLGESQQVLPRVLEAVGRPAVVFLDAHPSGEMTYGHKELMQGKQRYSQDSIIRAELEILLQRKEEYVIIIDDINGDEKFYNSYTGMILAKRPDYRFAFYDENLSGERLYPDKLLVAVPGSSGL